MAFISNPQPIIGQNVGNVPTLYLASCTETLSEVTTAGFLNNYINIFPYPLSIGNILAINYNVSSSSPGGTSSWFYISSISSGVITLTQISGAATGATITLPTQVTAFAQATNSSGNLAADTVLPTSSSATLVTMQHESPGAITVGNIAAFNDTNGTLNGGFTPSSTSAPLVTMQSQAAGTITVGNVPTFNDINGTLNAGFSLSFGTVGPIDITTTSYSIDVTSGVILDTSAVFVSIGYQSGTAAIIAANPGVDTIVVVFSDVPGADTTLSWVSFTAP